MEDPSNLMMISGVMVFSDPLDYERLRATIEDGLLPLDRFSQRVAQPKCAWRTPRWEDDPGLDLDYHLRRTTLPAPGDQAALQELASELASTQLDLTRPLWQFHLVEGYGEGSALICRLHHCIGDGIALVQVLLSLTTTEPEAPRAGGEPEATPEDGRRPGRRFGRRTRRLVRVGLRASGWLVRESMNSIADPSRALDLARVGPDGATALARLVLRWPDPRTIFKGPLHVPKRAAWSDPIPLADVKKVGRRLGGTVNDVLLTAMTGSLRRYLLERDESADGLNIRAVIPVNLRPPSQEIGLGNRFGLVFLSLPVGIREPACRLAELRRRMDSLKDSKEAPVAFGILNAIGLSPQTIQDIVVNIFGTKATAVMTNVMGPREQLYLAGAPLEALMFWVPQSGKLGMGVSILSYSGKVWMGVITDEGLVPDPEAIIAGFHVEFDELLQMAEEEAEVPSLAELSARVDEALAALDAILEKRGEREAAPDAAIHDGCQAQTRAGKPCKNRALAGSRFCRVHQEPKD
jgi:WS/DGAT/MGAT family acyltransferase